MLFWLTSWDTHDMDEPTPLRLALDLIGLL